MTFLATILVFGLLISVHEFGHFLAAKRAGVAVHEFAVGFGPRLVGWRYGETEYSFRAFPIGGFVRIAGTTPGQDDAGDRGFSAKPVGRRMQIIIAGPLMNFLLAVVLFATIFFVFGAAFPVTDEALIGDVIRGYPADKAGLKSGDVILAIDGRQVDTWQQMVGMIQESAGRPLRVTVRRGDDRLQITVVPTTSELDGKRGFIGVAPRMEVRRLGMLESVYSGVYKTGEVTVVWFRTVILMIRQKIEAEVAGPVGIGQLIGQATRLGLAQLLYLAAALSANIGIINLLPIPALDGSRLVFLALEGVRGRPLDPEKENFIHFIGFAFLILLALLITYRDIVRLNV